MKNKNFLFLIFIFILNGISFPQSENNYNVYSIKSDTLQIKYLLDRLKIKFDLRRQDVKQSLISYESLTNRQKKLREWYKNILPQFPEKTELNTVVTKKVEFEEYSVEWVVFESRPNHHVTGLFYLPTKGEAPFPAVYIPCGHSVLGKGGETYQKAAQLFALNGFAALMADPICQGERFQYLDKNGKAITAERMLMHEILGQKSLLTGSNTLIHELWDNIRGLDFLEQHPKIDKNKLAVAGNSGGGTQVTYLVAFDDRVKVATPSCYIATTEKKFNTIGSQDGCQQLWGEGKIGIEEQDFLLMAAPKPIRILSATDDFFHIDGAKTAYEELKKSYTVLGASEKIDQVIAEGTHGWHQPLREASVQWCKKWLLNDDTPVSEPENLTVFENENLFVSKSGQVLSSYENEKSVSDLTREKLNVCKSNRELFLSNNDKATIIKNVKNLIGYEQVEISPNYRNVGSFSDTNYEVEKYLITRDNCLKFELPAILFKPHNYCVSSEITIFVSEYGMLSELDKINREIEKGNLVLALDISNTGELKNNREPKYDNKEFWIGKLPIYEGKSLLAYRTEDILIGINFVKNISGVNSSKINIVSEGFVGPAAIHAALFNGGINNIYLTNSINDWEKLAASDYVSNQLGNIVPGVLNYYNLEDLLSLIPDTKISLHTHPVLK